MKYNALAKFGFVYCTTTFDAITPNGEISFLRNFDIIENVIKKIILFYVWNCGRKRSLLYILYISLAFTILYLRIFYNDMKRLIIVRQWEKYCDIGRRGK